MSEYLAWHRDMMSGYNDLFGRAPVTTGVIVVGDGWRGIVETMLSRMTDALRAASGSIVRIDRLETKHGILRVHMSGTTSDAPFRISVEDAADLAEARSACTCEYCGGDGRLFEMRSGWLITACERHGFDAQAMPPHRHAGLLIKRTFDGRRLTIVSCRRYLKSLDRFVDVDPNSVGLDE